ncbi:MAG: hypothetical protein ACPHJD_04905 [Poseidonia sp.]|jgi:hypothetical protein
MEQHETKGKSLLEQLREKAPEPEVLSGYREFTQELLEEMQDVECDHVFVVILDEFLALMSESGVEIYSEEDLNDILGFLGYYGIDIQIMESEVNESRYPYSPETDLVYVIWQNLDDILDEFYG